MSLAAVLLAFFIGCFLGFEHGWKTAHRTVAKECKVLGGFYVNGETFKCIEVIAHDTKEPS